MSGIDIALWDIKGKHFGASVATLLDWAPPETHRKSLVDNPAALYGS